MSEIHPVMKMEVMASQQSRMELGLRISRGFATENPVRSATIAAFLTWPHRGFAIYIALLVQKKWWLRPPARIPAYGRRCCVNQSVAAFAARWNWSV